MENNRYNNAKIYKLYDVIHGYFYIGSTCGALAKRLYEHKHTAKRQPETKVYKCFNSIGWENVKIILIEEHYLENRDQQMREENTVIEMYLTDEKCLNSVRPWFSPMEKEEKHKINQINVKIYKREYYEENIDKKKEYDKLYREKNREYYDKLKKQIFNCACGSECSITHKSRHEKTKKHQAWLNDKQQTSETI